MLEPQEAERVRGIVVGSTSGGIVTASVRLAVEPALT